ncbi:MAG TPA: asparagine synthase-related protein [Bryobacteraceae bacterium]|nr:asparagine synthase-related protein [Bryobacteraceae bacterium]
MSFQSGLSYFDERIVAPPEADAVVALVVSDDMARPAIAHLGQACLAFSSVRLKRAAWGAQPLSAESLAITFDGRLDNRDDLRLILSETLRDEMGDAALALATYRRWGVEGFSRLVGDWSLAIWDASDRAVVLASDFAGTRPLYYARRPNGIAWSTRLSPLVAWLQPEQMDDEYIATLLQFGGCPNRTPYAGIRSVPPGHALRLTAQGFSDIAFWKPPLDNLIRYQREEEYEEHLRALLSDAVRCRLSNDQVVLAELSGGLDSSSVVTMANHLLNAGRSGAKLITLTVDHSGSRDKPFWTVVEAMCKTESIHIAADDYPFLTAERTGGAMPGFWEPLQLRTAAIAREVGATTYLTGRTGDLVMGNWADDSDQVAGAFRRGQIAEGFKTSLAWAKALRIPIIWILWKAVLLNLRPSMAPRDASESMVSTENSIAGQFRKFIPSYFDSVLPQDWKAAPPERRSHFRTLLDIITFRRLQPPEPLHHLAYTHPLFHRPLVEFMMSIPPQVVCSPGEPRRLMRRALSPLWPPELRRRRSKDVFSGVFLESLRPLAHVMLQDQEKLEVVQRGYIELVSLRRRLGQLTHSLECNEPQLRQIILLEFWLRSRRCASVSHEICPPMTKTAACP